LFLLDAIQELPDLGQFFLGNVAIDHGGDEFSSGAAEGAMEEVSEQASLGLFFGRGRTIELRASRVVAYGHSLLVHDLEQFEGGVVGGSFGSHRFVNLANRAWPVFPEDLENLEFTSGGTKGRFAWHGISFVSDRGYPHRHEKFREKSRKLSWAIGIGLAKEEGLVHDGGEGGD
jgi:hypothetical protein